MDWEVYIAIAFAFAVSGAMEKTKVRARPWGRRTPQRRARRVALPAASDEARGMQADVSASQCAGLGPLFLIAPAALGLPAPASP
jgi:hypothetical protein